MHCARHLCRADAKPCRAEDYPHCQRIDTDGTRDDTNDTKVNQEKSPDAAEAAKNAENVCIGWGGQLV